MAVAAAMTTYAAYNSNKSSTALDARRVKMKSRLDGNSCIRPH